MNIYEVVDTTNEETYYTLGVFQTLEEALKELDKCDESPSEYTEDYCLVEVRERKLGWSDIGKCVAKREWTQVYNEKEDSYDWKRKDPNQPITI